ncbi:primary-amine oxidase [Cladochytrium replicatum]|nr:primary-amine oxidase [Cladochytrium replicatum]
MAPSLHPLELITEDEIIRAVAILKEEKNSFNYANVTFSEIGLQEPPKKDVLAFTGEFPLARCVRFIMIDNDNMKVYKAIVSLKGSKVISWDYLPNVQPLIHFDEFKALEESVKKHPDFIEAMTKRGIEDLSLVCIEPWSAGYYGDVDEEGKRLCRGLVCARKFPDDNLYAHPVENVQVIFDMNKNEVFKINDFGVVEVPQESHNFAAEFIKEYRKDLKPLEITQPEGPSFSVTGNLVEWQKWSFRVGFNAREGLVFHQIGYKDDKDPSRIRSILYRMSIAEMVVPYGDPHPIHSKKNAFDFGEYAAGAFANSLVLGCDCKGYIHYFDAVCADSKGVPFTIKNAVCMHEEDYGILWKHTDFRTQKCDSRRSRRLVVSFIATVGNYDYGFFWYFYQDGTIQLEVKLTGIVSTAPSGAETPEYGSLIAPGLSGIIHQHFFIARLDFDIDGTTNKVFEVNSSSDSAVKPFGTPGNLVGNAFKATATLLKNETDAQRTCDIYKARYWKVVSSERKNFVGEPTGFKIAPGENVLPMWDPEAPVAKRAQFATKHLWVTKYEEDELYGAGDFPNQSKQDTGVAEYAKKARNLEDEDVVVWYNFGHHHVVRPEDFPVMPVGYIGFVMKPVGFFDGNPALDVPQENLGKSKCTKRDDNGIANGKENGSANGTTNCPGCC